MARGYFSYHHLCPGLPGAGKTVMASIVKFHLDERMMDSNHPTAVLYFNYKRHLEDHDHRALLLAVLAQFLFRSEKVPDHLQKMFDRRPREPLRMNDTISVLESLVQSSQKSFLIMDALDEFYDDDGARSRFLHLIQRLQASGNLSIMMTARPHLTDDPAISKWSNATIQIKASDDDLHTYLDDKICGFPYLPEDFELRVSIADRIDCGSLGWNVSAYFSFQLICLTLANRLMLTSTKFSARSSACRLFERCVQWVRSRGYSGKYVQRTGCLE